MNERTQLTKTKKPDAGAIAVQLEINGTVKMPKAAANLADALARSMDAYTEAVRLRHAQADLVLKLERDQPRVDALAVTEALRRAK